MGNVTACSEDAALFGAPDRTSRTGNWDVLAYFGALSGGHSHIGLKTERSIALPAGMALSKRLGSHVLSAGYRRAMDAAVSVPDVLDPSVPGHMDLALEQIFCSWSYSRAGSAAAGLSARYSRADVSWDGQHAAYARGRAAGSGLAASLSVPLTPECRLWFGAVLKEVLRGTTDFLPAPGEGDLELSGTVPARTAFAVEYRPEAGFRVGAEAGMTGWGAVTEGYQNRFDLRLGAEVVPWGQILALRVGAFTMPSPLDEYERMMDPSLQDMYIVSAGIGLAWGPAELDVGAASSYPFSGKGQNQNMLAATAGVKF